MNNTFCKNCFRTPAQCICRATQKLLINKDINLKNKPSEPIMALGYMMRDWLSVMADKPDIDIGAGMNCFNLWAEVEGQKVFIEIKKSV